MAHRIDTIGYWGTCLVALTLPFNAANRQIGRLGTVHITQLTVIIVVLASLASVTILLSWFDQKAHAVSVDSHRSKLVAGLILALAVMALVSSVKSGTVSEAPTWLLSILAGGVLCIAIPIWIAPAPRLRATTVGRFFVAGAVISALIGFAEFTFGSAVEPQLVAFRPGPTLVDSYLRLSGPFSHANVAAMYFCLALPFSLNELVVSLGKREVSWVRSVAWLAVTDVLLLALLLTFSRGGLVAFAVSLVVMGLAAGRKSGLVRVFGSRRHLGLLLNGAIVLCMFALSTSSIDAMRLTGKDAAGWYAVGFETHGLSHMSPGEKSSIAVTVKNEGFVPWRASRHGEYAVGYHWLYPSWKVARFDNATTSLRVTVPAGHSTRVLASVTAPLTPGRYLLAWDLLSHGTTWFAEKTGSYSILRVKVSGPSTPSAGLNVVAERPDSYRPIRLPVAQTAGRTEIWQVALRIISASPALGMGPYGFLTNYDRFLNVSARFNAPPPSNAHNLVLELAVDYGLIGLGLFVAFLVLLWWPIARTALQSVISPGAQLAVLGSGAAFVTQGFVEYFLGTVSILFAFWLLCGLAQVGFEQPGQTP